MKIKVLCLFLIGCSIVNGFAGELFDSLYLDYFRYTDLSGITESDTLGFHTTSTNTRDFADKKHPWAENYTEPRQFDLGENADVSLLPVTASATWNSFNLMRGTQDGLQWRGKGFNAYFSAGAKLDSSLFSVSLLPEFTFSENSEYAIYNTTPDDYSYMFSGIDYPLRMGDEAFTQVSAGQSEVRLNYGIFTISLSHENMIWGPSINNPLIMSAAAEGFYHTDFGVKKTETKWGTFEARLVYGALEESDYFYIDDDDDNYTFFSGYMLAWSPPWSPYFSVGMNRSLLCLWDDINGTALAKLYSFAYVDEDLGLDKTDQRVSIWMDWKFMATGTNIYLEVFKEDHTKFIRSLLYYPDHTIGFTFGGEQVWALSQKRGFSLNAEYTWMQEGNSYELKASNGATYYVHGYSYHGYTNKGQLLGAPTGPGSDAQFLNLNYFDSWGLVKLHASRINYDKDYVFKYLGDNQDLNAEIRAGISSLVFLPYNMELNLGMSYLLVSGQAFEHDSFDHGFSAETGLTFRY